MYKSIWVVMLVISLISLLLGVILIFVWDILDILDELSGRKAKRQIKVLHDLNANTGAFRDVSTNDVYSSVSSGSFLYEELNNLKESLEVKSDDTEDGTSFLESSSTSYIDDDNTTILGDEITTDYLQDTTTNSKISLVINIVKEESSLGGIYEEKN